MPTQMWRVYNRVGISPYKPTYRTHPTSRNFAISPVRRIVKARRNLIRELENISLSVEKGDDTYSTILGIYTTCSYASICMYICVHDSVEAYVAYLITCIS